MNQSEKGCTTGRRAKVAKKDAKKDGRVTRGAGRTRRSGPGESQISESMYIYIYIYICVSIHICIYIYIYI